MPEIFYRVLHLVGILMTMVAIGSLVAAAREGTPSKSARRFGSMLHGIGLLVVLVAGFGLIAKLDYKFEGWVIGKLVIWFVLGGITAVIMKAPRLATLCALVTIALGSAAGYLVWAKPF